MIQPQIRYISLILILLSFSNSQAQDYLNGVLYGKLINGNPSTKKRTVVEKRLQVTSITYLSKQSNYRSRSVKSTKSGIERIVKIRYSNNTSPIEAANILMESGNYEYVSPCPKISPLIVPNDPFSADNFSNPKDGQTPLYTHNFWQAWDIEQGDSTIVIAILDGGVNFEHEDLKDKFKTNLNDPINGINDDGNWLGDTSKQLVDDYRGWDLGNWDNDPSNPPGVTHGSEVTGIACAATNNGVGISGTGYNSKYVHYKIANDTTPYNYDYGYDAIVLAVDNGAKIVNLSWGTEKSNLTPFLDIINDIITYAVYDKDAVLIAAAGNSSKNEQYYPASHPDVISVTGIRTDDTKQGISTYDYAVDIAASGWFAKTTLGNTTNDYNNSTGTSIATPVVSGAAALLRSKFPDYSSKQVMEKLRVTGDIIDTSAYNSPYQYKMGRKLNPYKALTDSTTPAIRITEKDTAFTVNPSGDNIDLSIVFTNFLAHKGNISAELIPQTPDYLTTENLLIIDTISTLEEISFSNAFNISTPSTSDTITANFIIKYTSDNYTDYEHIAITFYPDVISSLSDESENKIISISPNPNNGDFMVNLKTAELIQKIDLINTTGEIIEEFTLQTRTNRLPLELSNKKTGLFILNITTNKGFYSEKIWINE